MIYTGQESLALAVRLVLSPNSAERQKTLLYRTGCSDTKP